MYVPTGNPISAAASVCVKFLSSSFDLRLRHCFNSFGMFFLLLVMGSEYRTIYVSDATTLQGKSVTYGVGKGAKQR